MKVTVQKVLSAGVLILGILLSGNVSGQDIHFSQFYMSPLNLNPALTGVMNCNQRFVANYRNQWASILQSNSFSTYSASYDQKIPVGQFDYFGVGGTLWGDVAGSADFQTLQARLSGSYSRKMAGGRRQAHYLVVGADAGLGQRSIDFLKLQFGTQHDGEGGFDPNLPSQEDIGRDNFLFADVSAGLLWFSVLDENTNFYGGVAVHHLNRPNVSFTNDSLVSIFTKYTAHAGGEFNLTENLGLVPGVVAFKQGPSFLLNLGTSFRFHLAQSNQTTNTFQLGLWTRLVNNYFLADDPNQAQLGADAVIISARFEYESFNLGFSYDWNVSPLRTASNGNGAFEFSLVYTLCGAENRGVYCPNF
ncbi:MAG: PorP/SprF family type IX secretion system membrane protein [Saprospiraceae bacterium]|nr:PorP/SprF family type IX secretion system membrane protein [Saprospiraceae bacterium]